MRVAHTFSGHKSSQDEEELSAFIQLLRAHKVTKYLEIGARHGDTFHRIMSEVDSIGVAVDLPMGKWGTNSAADLTKATHDLVGRADMILGDSHDPVIHRQVRRYGVFDAVFIDGDHTYQGVRADYLAYSPIARIVALHDIGAPPGHTDGSGKHPVEVPALWRQAVSDRRRVYPIGTSGVLLDPGQYVEFITPGSNMGIGVLHQ